MTAPTTLDAWLGRCYVAEHMNKEPLPVALSAFKAWLAEDGERAVAASASRASITDEITKRDHISRKHKNYLDAALAS